MGSYKSLKTSAFLKKSDLLLSFSSLLIGLKWQEFSNFWMIPFKVRIFLLKVVAQMRTLRISLQRPRLQITKMVKYRAGGTRVAGTVAAIHV